MGATEGLDPFMKCLKHCQHLLVVDVFGSLTRVKADVVDPVNRRQRSLVEAFITARCKDIAAFRPVLLQVAKAVMAASVVAPSTSPS